VRQRRHSTTRRRLAWIVAAILAVAGCTPPCFAQSGVTFDIKNLTATVTEKFKKEFFQRQETLEKYLASTRFTEPFSGPIDVDVSDGQSFSEALIFAWEGRRGHMYFPAARAKEGRAAILHELTHVNAPNQVRFLAEGYPAYLEAQMGNIKAYPTLGHPIECEIRDYSRAYRSALRAVNFAVFDGVSTQKGVFLGDNIGLETAFPANADGISQRRAYAYLVSASFVKLLVESYGLEKFKALYDLTPLTPGRAPQADRDRYRQVFFGKSVSDLQTDWLRALKEKQRSCP